MKKNLKNGHDQFNGQSLSPPSEKEPFKPATELKKDLNIAASVQTVRHCLREHDLKSCSPRKVPRMISKHLTKRIALAKEHSKWLLEKWRNVL